MPERTDPIRDPDQLLERLRAAERDRDAVRKRSRHLAWGLAVAVLLFVTTAGGAWWLWTEQRQAALARQKEAADKARPALERARALLDEGWRANDPERLKDARAEAERAAEIARGGGADEVLREAEALRQEVEARLAHVERNRALLSDLLDIAIPRETGAYQSVGADAVAALAQPSAEEEYAAAFRRWGVDLDRANEAEIVARLRGEPEAVQEAAIGGLDAWMLSRRRQKRPEAEWRRLYRMAEQVDGDEVRRQLRTLLIGDMPPRAESVTGLVGGWPPWPALWELARGEKWRRLRALQQQTDPATAPVLTVILLALASEQVGDATGAERLLRRAAAARPDAVVLLDTLGKILERQRPARLAEAIECFRAARAVRPRLGVALAGALNKAGRGVEGEAVVRDLIRQQPSNPELHAYLGHALAGQKKPAEAAAAYRRAIALKPDFAEAYNDLGVTLHEQQKLDEAIASYRKALDLDPNLTAAQVNLDRALKGEGPKE
jgi:Flp pilus assembly protein TadD